MQLLISAPCLPAAGRSGLGNRQAPCSRDAVREPSERADRIVREQGFLFPSKPWFDTLIETGEPIPLPNPSTRPGWTWDRGLVAGV